jgi:hypothetical protein
MCTVSFIPGSESVLLSSNRDEKHFRSDAIPPTNYAAESGQLLYPKDGDAGGTWIALHELGHAIVFLNGACVAHQPNPPYRMSRGQVLLQILRPGTPVESAQEINLDGIEPFTAVIWSNGSLYVLRWDGSARTLEKLDESRPHIWSSVTLYGPEIVAKRESWFQQWLSQNHHPSLSQTLDFHQFTGDGDAHNDLRMNRNGQVYTVSITGLEISSNRAIMKYLDLKNNQQFDQELLLRSNHLYAR